MLPEWSTRPPLSRTVPPATTRGDRRVLIRDRGGSGGGDRRLAWPGGIHGHPGRARDLRGGSCPGSQRARAQRATGDGRRAFETCPRGIIEDRRAVYRGRGDVLIDSDTYGACGRDTNTQGPTLGQPPYGPWNDDVRKVIRLAYHLATENIGSDVYPRPARSDASLITRLATCKANRKQVVAAYQTANNVKLHHLSSRYGPTRHQT
ncbi:uncharacterized protein BDZ99DRAFT_546546 [Mytilinidion resinicola]|uniref:Uncharacterized protein n=1 Tax=Mytilinidion resinicola TaxID=574789 RepID=A0A6A6Y7W2_9PEZI|nr:uncharacterized protein BDZ99DRAFT_546546 [Mytilinidion resinicola]KAF2803897.1 hypothetical protein BDZ99DRAFT_546546 [Mytilinidion resinicola]